MARLLFLQNHHHEFLGPMYISARVRDAGHECRLAVGTRLEDLAAVIETYRPHMVAFSVMTGGHLWAMRMAEQVKRAYGVPNVFGGPHPTFFPQFALEPCVDLIVRGEGEETMVDILDRLDTGEGFERIPNVGCRRDGAFVGEPVRCLVEDLDALPFPDRHLYDILPRRIDRGVPCVITTRGCPYACTFCCQDALRKLYRGKGRFVRVRRIDKVIEECRQLRTERKPRAIYFADDVFGIDRKWLYDFLEAYRQEIGLPFVCLVRANQVASDREYARRLAQAGCHAVFFGVETGREGLRNDVLKKNLRDEDIYIAAKLLHEEGIRFRTYNILGLPGETLEDAFQTVQMNVQIKADYPWCSIFTPYPGTELAEYAREIGCLPETFDYRALSESFFVDSKLNMPHIREMENLQKFFQTAVLWPQTLPIIRRLIRLRPNGWFQLWFGFVYFLLYVRSERRGLWKTLGFALANARHVLR